MRRVEGVKAVAECLLSGQTVYKPQLYRAMKQTNGEKNFAAVLAEAIMEQERRSQEAVEFFENKLGWRTR